MAYREISLQLEDVHDLFTEPVFEPFSENQMTVSGMDYLYNHLKTSRLTERVRAAIFLPQDKIEPDLTQRLRRAIVRYCQYQILSNQNELKSIRWQAIKALQSGLIFLGGCLLVSTLADNLEILPEWLRHLASEGFLIAGWVSLWHPIELILYEWWPYWREIHVYKHLMTMEVIIEGTELSS